MGCNDTKCSMFVGIDTNIGNHSYLDIYLDGKAEAWAAVGFAKTPHMVSVSHFIYFVNAQKTFG